MGLWEAMAVLTGLVVVFLILAATSRREFDGETPKYEMLGWTPPEHGPAPAPGRLGPTDRIVRLGSLGTAFYYAGEIGWLHPLGLALATAGVYFLLTGLLGRDPVYRLAHLPR